MNSKKLPQHVAIIMDGNGRWARKRHLPRVRGHQRGVETTRMVVRACGELGIPYLTLYAFSQENWRRPSEEVDFLMDLLSRMIKKELDDLKKQGVRFRTIGHIEGLPKKVQKSIRDAERATEQNSRLTLILALNYGAHREILDAAQRLWKDVASANGTGDKRLQEIDEASFSRYLDTADFPDPDLMIRTSGEMRLSNFLLWQCSYSEFHVSQKLWPEFAKKDFLEAIEEYGRRHRRFGAVA